MLKQEREAENKHSSYQTQKEKKKKKLSKTKVVDGRQLNVVASQSFTKSNLENSIHY